MALRRGKAGPGSRQTEQLLWQVLDRIPEGVVVCDKEGMITFTNPAARQLYQHPDPGYLPLARHSEALQLFTPAGEIYPPERLPLSRSALEGLVLEDVEVVVRWPSGAQRTLLCSTTPLWEPPGRVIGAIGVFRDVTPVKEAEAERSRLIKSLEAERGYLQSVLDQMPSGVLIAVAPDGREIMCNLRFKELVDRPMRSVDEVPVGWIMRRDGTVYRREELPLIRALENGESVRAEELIYESKAGNQQALLSSAAPVRDREGRTVAAVLVLTDMTQIAELERVRESVLEVLAHELRNPLAAASALVQLVSSRVSGSEAGAVEAEWLVERLRLAGIELERLKLLVNEVVAGYKVSRGALSLELALIDLRKVTREAVESVRVVGAAKTFEVNLEEGGPVRVQGDWRRLYDLLRSLLSNAVKYSPDGGRIWVSLSSEGGSAFLRVEDEGSGIPPDQLETVFELFAGANHLPDRHPEGIGLGLYVSREVARRHGGDLWAENRPQGGTRMCLRLPLAR